MKKKIPVSVSARHVHLKQGDVEKLFGKGAELTVFKSLFQPGSYACNEKVDIVTDKGMIKGVRILGPMNKQTQVEISMTDALKLKVNIPIRASGNLKNSAACKLVGPAGELVLKEGLIGAQRHIHASKKDAEELGICDKQIVSVCCIGVRGLKFDNVLVRINNEFKLEMHIDTDEANACFIGECNNEAQIVN